MEAPSLKIWYEALASEFGVVYQTNDPEGARRRLYALRAEANDPDLSDISICSSPTAPQTDLWLVKGRKENGKD